MVKKLLKHEFIYYFRTFGLFLPIVLVVGIMTKIFSLFDSERVVNTIVTASSAVMLVISCCGLIVLAMVIAIVRFYKNMYSAEGYLTFTLPVTNHQHILVKLLAAWVFQVICYAVVIASAAIAMPGELLSALVVDGLIGTLKNSMSVYGVFNAVGFIIECALIFILYSIFYILLYYACITIGQTAKKNRVLMAIVAYFVYYVITQVVATVFIIVFMLLGMTGIFDVMVAWMGTHLAASMHIAFCLGICGYAALALVAYFVTHRVMTKKLNLE